MISKAHHTLINIEEIVEIVRVLVFLGRDNMCPGVCRNDIEEHIWRHESAAVCSRCQVRAPPLPSLLPPLHSRSQEAGGGNVRERS